MSASEPEPDDKTALQLAYGEFVAVLRGWDEYIWPEVKTAARDISTASIEVAAQHGVPPGTEMAVEMRFSDLATALWKSLEAGAKEVDRVHDEIFVAAQVEFFKETYADPEQVAAAIDDCWDTLEAPQEIFAKLGKPAQLIIVREDLLQKAIDVYAQAELINYRKARTAVEARKNQLREARERRAHPDYIRPISQRTRVLVRELDKHQCVFCGSATNGRNRYMRLTPKGYKTEDVVLVCLTCARLLENDPTVLAGMEKKFGRFSSDSSLNTDSTRDAL